MKRIPREKWLGFGVAGLVACVLLWSVAQYVSASFRARETRMGQLRQDIERREAAVRQGKQVQRMLRDWEQRAIPGGKLLSTSHARYQEWLLATVRDAGLSQATVRPTGQVAQPHNNAILKYNLTAKGTLPQWIRWCQTYYAVGRLHLLRSVTLKPLEGTNQLTIVATCEVFAMPGATDRDVVDVPPPAAPVSDDQVAQIAARNFFLPPNQAPQLVVPNQHQVTLGETLTIQAEAKDPDPWDTVTYGLVSGPEGATVDPQTGAVAWKPTETGDYKVVVRAEDSGGPPLSSEMTLTLHVAEKKQEAVVETRPPIGFDDAQQAYFCAMTEINDRPQAWLQVRSTGTVLFLAEGDPLHVGSVRGTISKIEARMMEIELGERRVQLQLGDSLAKVVANEADAP